MKSPALEQHRAAAMAVNATAMSIPPDRWNEPIAPGKWSPGEITEHLRLTYVTLNRELTTGEGMRVRTKWLQRLILRTFLLPRILRTGRIPTGAPAAREIRPGGGPFDQQATIRQLDEETLAFERNITSRPGATVTHHIFGKADATTALRFCAVHLLHHEQQLLRNEEKKY